MTQTVTPFPTRPRDQKAEFEAIWAEARKSKSMVAQAVALLGWVLVDVRQTSEAIARSTPQWPVEDQSPANPSS